MFGSSLRIGNRLDALRQQSLLRQRRQFTPFPGGWCEVDGRRLRNLASNDYLNLVHDPRVTEAAREAIGDYGMGAGASALVTGRTNWHVQLERQLARFEGHEAALLFPSGYAANVGTISALVDPEDSIFCDRLNHASLIDGCRLSGARFRVYRHDRLDRLRRELSRTSGTGRRFIVTDSVFSMDGDVAPLGELADLADRFEATVIVDEAHATGVFGTNGRGVTEWLQLEDAGFVRIGTLSKAVGSLGGFVTGSQELIDWLWNRARTQIFSTALPPACCAAACAALEIIEREPERREHLWDLSAWFRNELGAADFPIRPGGMGPILPLVLQAPDLALSAADRLAELGYWVAAIRPPTVPEGTSRLRITLNSALTKPDLHALLEALKQVVGPETKQKVERPLPTTDSTDT